MRSTRLAALAALSMIIGSTAAVAQSGAPLSISAPAARAGDTTDGSSELDRRGIGIYIVGALVLGLLIWGIIELTGSGERSRSP